MRTPVRIVLPALVVGLALAACGGKRDNEPAVATPSVSLNKDKVPIDSVVTVTYKFVVAQNATFDKDCWHPAEVDAKNPQNQWTWTKKTATISFKNPKKDATLYLQYDARVDLFNPPQQVTLKIGEQTIGTFAADAKGSKILTFPVTA